ncbi:putative lipoyltransferase 2, mitochondrial isoform X1 [Thrips palmi]|uniref:Octanoyl-[acyl-carrier-protein]:protein N-octanoyltransferase LIPT2, mitochondrial n=1 Tax=Thrips palmi TaxID=161013 RepID=A0A6P8Y5K9_THRPL|nr:putative lipoyltransferase 2, mitochondrial isoform X1 [Thrips palmi]
MAHVVHVWNVGRMTYTPALRLQKHLTERYKSAIDSSSNTKSINDILLLVEHDPVYTVGIRNREYDKKEEMRLKNLGAEFHRTNRGGLITFHGPGQLVAYPIMNLKNLENPGVRCYVSAIEETIIMMCKAFGIRAERSPHTGVWVADNKICAIGIHASRYITSHGLALNCNTDLKWFEHIVPCGIEGKGVTSLTRELGLEMSINRTIPHFLRSFSSTFKCKLQPLPQESAELLIAGIQ